MDGGKEMKVKEMIEYLQKFNPEAEVFSVINYSPYPPRFSFGCSEGCTERNCDEVYITVNEAVEQEAAHD